MKTIKEIVPKAICFFLIITVICGIGYTLIVTLVAQTTFKEKANGSIIEVDGKKYGSELLAQKYVDDSHLWGRIMILNTETFVDDEGNKLMYASPSNISPTSEKYGEIVAERVSLIEKSHPEKAGDPVPVDLVTCSGSGLDPHISVAAAQYQIERLARNTGKSQQEVEDIINKNTSKRFLGVFGESTVNVLKVNLELDGILK